MAPSTLRSYHSILLRFFTFLASHKLSLSDPPLSSFLAYAESLTQQGLSPSTIANHLSSLKSSFSRFSLPVSHFSHPSLSSLLRAIKRTSAPTQSPKSVFSIQDLHSLVSLAQTHPLSLLLVPLFCLIWVPVNLQSSTQVLLSSLPPLLRGDISLFPSHAIISLRWTKSRQNRSQLDHVQIPSLPGHPLCPIQALQALFQALPLSPSAPFFSYYKQSQLVSLTQVQARVILKSFCSQLGLPYHQLGFHAFRRSAVSYLFSNNTPLTHLQQHGTWSSDAIYSYPSNSSTSSYVPSAFRSLLL